MAVSTLQYTPATGTPLAPSSDERALDDRPDFVRDEVKRDAPKRTRCHHLMGGSDAMWANATTYLPKWPGEDDETYAVRSTLTELYNAFERTVSAGSGLVFAKPPTLDDSADVRIAAHWEDIDGQGTHAKVFLKNLFDDGLQDGLIGILVEYPKVAPATGTPRAIDEAEALGLRPRWVPYCRDQIINWRTTKIGARIVLALLVLKEEIDVDSGEFGVAKVTQFREIRRSTGSVLLPDGSVDPVATRPVITFQVWRERTVAERTEWYVADQGEYRGVTEIPFAIGYTGRKLGVLAASVPLSALAELNIGQYRVSADRRYLMSIVHAPTPVITGWTEAPRRADGQEAADEGQLRVGPGAAMKLTGDAKFAWVQADPTGLDSSKTEKDDQKTEMASLSIAYLAQDRKVIVTATAHRINSIAQNASLATAADALQDCVAQALVFHCQYLEVDVVPSVTVHITYDEDALDAPTIMALNQMAVAMNITRRTLLLILQRGEIIPDEVDLDEEEAALDAEHQQQQDAVATAARQARLLAMAGAAGGGGPAPAPKVGPTDPPPA